LILGLYGNDAALQPTFFIKMRISPKNKGNSYHVLVMWCCRT